MSTDPQKFTTAQAAQPADWEALRASCPSDFDGHTEFERMSATERLSWLEMAAEFVQSRRPKFLATGPAESPALAEEPAKHGVKPASGPGRQTS